MPYTFANTIDGSVDITYPDAKVRTIPVNSADMVKDPVNEKITISYVGEGAWSFAVGVADVSPTQASLDALHTYLAGFFFADPGGGSVVLPQYANSLTVNAMYRGAALPDPDQQIDGPGTTPPLNGEYRVLFIADNPVETGPYFTDSQGDWIRDPDYNTGAELNALHVHVNDGDVFGDTDWYQSEATPLVGADPITFIPAAVMMPDQVSPYWSRAKIAGDGVQTSFLVKHLHIQTDGGLDYAVHLHSFSGAPLVEGTDWEETGRLPGGVVIIDFTAAPDATIDYPIVLINSPVIS